MRAWHKTLAKPLCDLHLQIITCGSCTSAPRCCPASWSRAINSSCWRCTGLGQCCPMGACPGLRVPAIAGCPSPSWSLLRKRFCFQFLCPVSAPQLGLCRKQRGVGRAQGQQGTGRALPAQGQVLLSPAESGEQHLPVPQVPWFSAPCPICSCSSSSLPNPPSPVHIPRQLHGHQLGPWQPPQEFHPSWH